MLTLGETLKNARVSKDLILQRVCDHAKISTAYLSDLENSKALRPKIEILQKIAAFLEIDTDALIICAEKIPPDVYWKIIRNPQLLNIIRNLPV